LSNPWSFNVSWVVQSVMVQCFLILWNQLVFKFPPVFNELVNFLLFDQWVLKYHSLQPASFQISVRSTSECSNFNQSVKPVSVWYSVRSES
jgi:hypothetical protein